MAGWDTKDMHFKTSHVIVYLNLPLAIRRFAPHFKTSHGIVYLHGLYCGYTAGLFQNISCYCLSEFKTYETEPVNIFQNISCYCLSEKQELATRQKFHFKTSHVIVYRFTNNGVRFLITISKHLMLLFIKKGIVARNLKRSISKHLMLLFIGHFETVSTKTL